MTYIETGKCKKQNHFNSHAHVERDGQTDGIFQFDKDFNSHAHVERDLFNITYRIIFIHFNSHAHVERDDNCGAELIVIIEFQLTRSRGA